MTLDPDPLHVEDDLAWHEGYDAGERAGLRDGIEVGVALRSLRRLELVLGGIVIGSLLTLLAVGIVRAAPPDAALPLPGVDGQHLGAPPDPGVAQRQSTAPPMVAAEVPGSNPGSGVKGDAPLSGIASWYPARGLIAAAGPGLRIGDWRGTDVTVTADGRSVTVRLADWCACPRRLIDLSDDAFARLAPLSRGLVHVTVSPAFRSEAVPTLPPTDGVSP